MKQITFLMGHPVPFSATVQHAGRSVADATPYIEAFRDYLRPGLPTGVDVHVYAVRGAYLFYEYVPRRPAGETPKASR